MPKRRAFIASLGVAFVVASVVADRGTPQSSVTGAVVGFESGEWMSVSNDTTDPRGIRLVLRETTVYGSHPAAIRPGARVTVWYRSMAESRPVAARVRVLPDAVNR